MESDSTEAPRTRRSGGGRAGRHAQRAARPAAEARPVRAGMVGGRFNPLAPHDVHRIHEAALDALETIGMRRAPPETVATLTGAGAVMGDDGRIRIPRALVEDALAMAAKSVTLHGRDPAHDLLLEGERVHYGTAGAAVSLVDPHTQTYRDSTTQDLYDAARLVQALDNIHFFQRCMVCRDAEDDQALDLNSVYACCAGTSKHVGLSFVGPETMPDCIEMLHMIAGGEDKFRARPFCSNTNCFVVPPLTFAEESCKVLEIAVRAGMPVLLLSAGQAGATAPAPIAAAIVQAVAECLAGLVIVNAVKPGAPAIFGTWPFVSDLRTGAMSGGSGEQALLTAACAQMHRFYGLPGGAAAGIADAKLPDFQAGYEQAISNVMAGLAGLNMVYEAAGMHASLLGFCFESLILGDDLLGQAMRCVRGIEVSEDTTSIEVMKAVCLDGPGHYLGADQTLKLMETEYVYPALADRSSPKEWVERGKPDLLARATERKDAILGRPAHQIDEALDAALQARFDIKTLKRAH